MKNILSIHRQGEGHWVGDGFPVHTIFHYGDGPQLSPFLLLDHAGPAEFRPAEKPRGVDWHPHRGFETVTIVYKGEVDHADTAGNGGHIGPGDVQWMTAGSGLLHREFHGTSFTKSGGPFEMLQLWVNLPAKSKMTAPRYQALAAQDIPAVVVGSEGAVVRVIAGEVQGHRGPATTFTPIDLFDVRLHPAHGVTLELAEGSTAALYVLKGRVSLNGNETASGTELVVLDRRGSGVRIDALEEAVVFVMAGEPIEEPVAGYGPFVMNTMQEIHQAFADLNQGKMGRIP